MTIWFVAVKMQSRRLTSRDCGGQFTLVVNLTCAAFTRSEGIPERSVKACSVSV